MQITFLVGNGFDLGVGLKTSFEDFCKWYVQQDSKTNTIENFKEEIKNDLKTWADFEMALGKYTEKFSPETVEAFYECYEDAHDSVVEYLQKVKTDFMLEDLTDEDIETMRNGISNYYQELNPKENTLFSGIEKQDEAYNTRIQFISFNYTDCLDRYVKLVSNEPLRTWDYNGKREFAVNPEVLHIHGTETNFPILGVSEKYQIVNQELLSVDGFAEMMVKPQSVQFIGEPWYEDAMSEINQSQIICITGMSLGESDSLWWEKINQWIRGNTTRRLIVFWYETQPLNRISILQDYTTRNKVKEKLLSYSGLTKEQKEALKSRIHIVINTKSVLQIPKHEEESEKIGERKELATV